MNVKTIITRKEDNVITNIATVTEMRSNGLMVDNSYIIAGIDDSYNVYPSVETDPIIMPEKYSYTTAGGFAENLNYKPFMTVDQQIEKLLADNAQLGADLKATQEAINMLLGI